MTETGHYHRDAVLTAIFYRIGIADRTARLNYIADSGLIGDFYTVGEGEEGVGSHG